jgi:amino acid transporter
VGTIIGAGIYSVIAPAAGAAGYGVWLSFLLAAVISSFSGLSYAEIASALPGAIYSPISDLIGTEELTYGSSQSHPARAPSQPPLNRPGFAGGSNFQVG